MGLAKTIPLLCSFAGFLLGVRVPGLMGGQFGANLVNVLAGVLGGVVGYVLGSFVAKHVQE
mgnify:CR=1 FL=1